MHPRKNDPPLSVIDLSTVTVGSLEQLLQETDYFGFPCVVTKSSQLLDGYITRKDVQYVVGEYLKRAEKCITVKPPIKDTQKEDKPPNKGQAESTHSIENHL